jgi:cyclophilin family peptidyl-prolyl cis-trans isomerase
MMMRLFVLMIVLCCGVLALAQNYNPKSGETVMRIAVEGRGNVFVLLHTKEAPRTTSHIIRLVEQKFYDGQRFHRVAKSPRPFLVQVGDPGTKTIDVDDPRIGSGGSGARIPFEDTGKANVAGAVGLSTVSGDKNSGDSQFYMLLAPSKFLDGSYTVFGQVVAGMDVLAKIEKGDRVVSVTLLRG